MEIKSAHADDKAVKKVTCAQMGGPPDCDREFTGNFREVIEEGMKHYTGDHEEYMKKMEAESTPEKMEQWWLDFDKVWEEAPEV